MLLYICYFWTNEARRIASTRGEVTVRALAPAVGQVVDPHRSSSSKYDSTFQAVYGSLGVCAPCAEHQSCNTQRGARLTAADNRRTLPSPALGRNCVGELRLLLLGLATRRSGDAPIVFGAVTALPDENPCYCATRRRSDATTISSSSQRHCSTARDWASIASAQASLSV